MRKSAFSGGGKRRVTTEVKFEPDQLMAMRLVLGANVHFVVRQRRLLDAVGRTRATEHVFVREVAAELPLDDEG